MKYCQNWSIIGPGRGGGVYTLVEQLQCLLGGTGRLFYSTNHEPPKALKKSMQNKDKVKTLVEHQLQFLYIECWI